MNQWQPYLIAIMVGLLVGVEREKAHSTQTMGVRTFILISLLGAIAGGLQNLWLAVFLTIFALGLILISYFIQAASKSSGVDRGLTTEFAGGIVFCLGYAAHESPALAALIGPIVALVLFSKKPLHRFTHTIKPSELETALLLLLGAVTVINLAPDAFIDPWNILNPRKFGYLILILATLEFLSYVLTKIFGEKKSSLILGFLGGLVSSTAVLLSSARQARQHPAAWRHYLCSTIAAKISALAELLLIVALISQPLFVRLVMPVGVGILVGLISLFIFSRRDRTYHSEVRLRSPLDWLGVLRLSFVLGAVLGLISFAKLWLGDRAIFAASFVMGLFELHGVSLANATMQSHGHLDIDAATTSILIAIVGSFVAKTSTAWTINRGTFSRALTIVFLPTVTVIIATAWLYTSLRS